MLLETTKLILNKSTIGTVFTLAVLTTFIPRPIALAVLFRTPSLLAVTTLDTRIFMTKGNCSSYHYLIDSLCSYLTKLLSILTALAITIFAIWAYIMKKCTIRKTLTVEFQTFGFFALASCDHCLIGFLDWKRHLMLPVFSIIARRIQCFIDLV